eukprot:sb/3474139/
MSRIHDILHTLNISTSAGPKKPKNKGNLFGTPVAFSRYLMLREMHPSTWRAEKDDITILNSSEFRLWVFSRSIKYRLKATGVPNKFPLFFGLVYLSIYLSMDRRYFTKFIIVFERKRHKIDTSRLLHSKDNHSNCVTFPAN